MNKYRTVPSWYPADIFSRAFLTTTLDVDKEYWLLLRSYSEVKTRGIELVKSYGIADDKLEKSWKSFRAYVRQAENYWLAGQKTPYQSSPLLYYYSFMNLVKAFLFLKYKGILNEPMRHGLFRKNKTSYSVDLRTCKMGVQTGSDKIFNDYYKSVFNVACPNELSLHYLLGFCTDVSYQFVNCGYGSSRTHPGIYRFAMDNGRKKCWIVMALAKSSPMTYYKTYFKDFFNELEKVEVKQRVGPGFRELFGFTGLQWTGFDYYQSKDQKEVDYISDNQAPVGLLIAKLNKILLNNSSPSYVQNEFNFYMNFPQNRTKTEPMSEELAIYASMFYMGELVRYNPNYLYSILESESFWLLQSFVESCPIKYLRAIVARIIQPATKNILIVTN